MLMQMEFYCDLYVSECWHKKKAKIIKKLIKNRIQPQVYVIALAQGEQNQLEFFSSILLKQHVFEHAELFIVGIADGYDEALDLTKKITGEIYSKTGDTDLRKYILGRQKDFVKAGH